MKGDQGQLSALGSRLSALVAVGAFVLSTALTAYGLEPAPTPTPSREPRAESRERERSEPYLLGPEDGLAIRVVGYDEFSGVTVVGPDGRVSAPGVGAVPATGKSAEELAATVAGRLKRWVRDPVVTITVTQFRSLGQVFVSGQVVRPNTYPYRPGLTVAEVLALAGGPLPDADLAKATLFRAGVVPAEGGAHGDRLPERVDLTALLREGASAPPIVLRRGDMLMLPRANRPRVNVLGDVLKAGPYEVTETARVLDALQLAQGPRPTANLKSASLTRDGVVTPLDLQALLRGGDTAGNLLLRDGDTILVPENRMKVYVLGEVAKPDVVILPERATLLDALAAAGGHTRDADLKQVRVARQGKGGQPEVQTLDLTRLVAVGKAASGLPKAVVPPTLAEGDLLFIPSRGRKKSLTDYLPFLYPIELLSRALGG